MEVLGLGLGLELGLGLGLGLGEGILLSRVRELVCISKLIQTNSEKSTLEGGQRGAREIPPGGDVILSSADESNGEVSSSPYAEGIRVLG